MTAIGSAVQLTAVMYLTLEILRRVFKPQGLGRVHFQWPEETLAGIEIASQQNSEDLGKHVLFQVTDAAAHVLEAGVT